MITVLHSVTQCIYVNKFEKYNTVKLFFTLSNTVVNSFKNGLLSRDERLEQKLKPKTQYPKPIKTAGFAREGCGGHRRWYELERATRWMNRYGKKFL